MVKNMKELEFTITAGPCAAESPEQMLFSAQEARARNIDTVRMSLWKPRTKPGFDGIGARAIPILLEVAQMGLRPATEVLSAAHTEAVMNGVLGKDGSTKILIWLGSRNQNHEIQQSIGRAISGESRVMLMIKNQMWNDPNHWMGIVDHVLSGGASANQIMLCHRGFAPSSHDLRNPPDLDMALRIKKQTGLPMIGDPSHIAGGSAQNVIAMAERIIHHETEINGSTVRFDGIIIEVHPNPVDALTDKQQQLTWNQLDQIIRFASHRFGNML